ncbi:hypothetical protein ASE65_04595 [Sphingomonas sp. Leaf16]|nr:hypothetical protein ASE65_04595 [Sphingomonas sp. Leaf16]KQN13871.1 hypothetical protein ASE81_04665 [Sphingomonas sp. Leaf29]KQN23869.1 hypothetical protein ASE83_00745 [Sphingomonas sp. Leaf32]
MIDLARSAGFDVVEAYNADAAMALLELRPDIRVVLADIDMPGTMDGLKLAAAVRRRWPPVEIILTTAGKAPLECDMPERAVFLPKPLNHRKVVRAIQQMAA